MFCIFNNIEINLLETKDFRILNYSITEKTKKETSQIWIHKYQENYDSLIFKIRNEKFRLDPIKNKLIILKSEQEINCTE